MGIWENIREATQNAFTRRMPPEGEIDHDHDSVIDRNRGGRLAFTLLMCVVAFLLPIGLLWWIWAPLWKYGIPLGVYAISYAVEWTTVIVPITNGLVTLNNLSGKMETYGPGLHPAYPWEEVHEDSNYSIEIETLRFEESIPTRDDVPIVRVATQIKPILKKLHIRRRVATSTMMEGLGAVIRSELSSDMAGCTLDEAINQKKEITRHLQDLADKPLDHAPSVPSETVPEGADVDAQSITSLNQLFREIYGIKIVRNEIEDIDPSDDVKTARAGRAEADPIRDIAIQHLGFDSMKDVREAIQNGKLSQQALNDALTHARVITGNSNEQVFTVSGLGDLGSVARDVFGKGGS